MRKRYIINENAGHYFSAILLSYPANTQIMDTRLLKICEKMVEEEKERKKKKSLPGLPKEKRIMYYSGWGSGKSVKKEKEERQEKLV